MLKIRENKTRKGLRITMCVLYLLEIVLCALPYYQYITEDNTLKSYSVINILTLWGSDIGSEEGGMAAIKYSLFVTLFFIIPIVGFFFCALDKERNMKNIVSIFCCLAGVLSIILIVGAACLSIASVLALLLYILISFISVIAIFARFSDKQAEQHPAKQKNDDPNREV